VYEPTSSVENHDCFTFCQKRDSEFRVKKYFNPGASSSQRNRYLIPKQLIGCSHYLFLDVAVMGILSHVLFVFVKEDILVIVIHFQ